MALLSAAGGSPADSLGYDATRIYDATKVCDAMKVVIEIKALIILALRCASSDPNP